MSEIIEGGGVFASAVNRKISRRSFLKWSAAIGATASASGLILNAASERAKADPMFGSVAPASGGDVTQWVPTHCLVCHSWCYLAVGLDANLCVRKIEGGGGQPKVGAGSHLNTGNASNVWNAKPRWEHKEDCNYTESPPGYLPYYFNNRGRICAKGNSGMQHLYDPDRVKYPLERMGDRGSGRWRRVSWEYAIAKIAMVLRELGKAGYKVDSSGNVVVNRVSGTLVDIDGNTRPESELAQDLRHRFVFYAGRNESEGAGRFTGRYGTPNHIEHTSLCESSRHGAQIHMMGDKFPIPDLSSHCTLTGHYTFSGGASQPHGERDLSPHDDTDFMLEFGGNPCEVKIPSASYSVRWTDRRRDGGPSGKKCRMVTVDVRQSNTVAFSDEWVAIVPGTDGALAAGLIYEIARNVSLEAGDALPGNVDNGFKILWRRLMGWNDAGTASQFITRGHLGAGLNGGQRKLVGIFAQESNALLNADIPGGAQPDLVHAAGDDWAAVPWNDRAAKFSVEKYVKGALPAAIDAPGDPVSGSGGGVTAKTASWAAQVCSGTTPGTQAHADACTTISYLAAALAGRAAYNMFSTSGSPTSTIVTIPEYENPSVDGYRGPSKHSNGVYGYKLVRALAVLAGSKKGGAVDRPGTLNHNAWGGNDDFNPGGMTGGGGTARAVPLPNPGGIGLFAGDGGEYGGGGANNNADGKLRVDGWDYEHGASKFHLVTHKIDQMVVPGIRASLGMHPFKAGALTQLNRAAGSHTWNGLDRRPPYNVQDSTFQVEALTIFKNGVGNTRANIKLDQELAVKKGADGKYLLKHLYSIDMCMGDYSRFADIILPDTSYLERYDAKSYHETFGHKHFLLLRQPVVRPKVDAQPIFLYDARPVNAIVWMLGRAIEGNWYYSDNSGIGYLGGTTTPWQAKLGGVGAPPWNGNLFDSFNWDGYNSATNTITAATTDWALAHEGYGRLLADIGVLPGLSSAGAHVNPNAPPAMAERFRFWKANGLWWHSDNDGAHKANLYARTDVALMGGGWNGGGAPIRAWTDYFVYPTAGGNTKVPDLFLAGKANQTNDPSAAGGTLASGDQNFQPAGTNADLGEGTKQGKPWPYPVYVPLTQQTDATYPLHLTTYKLNVHTQSRTASVPRLTEIIGNNWAVINTTTAASLSISNGDTVKVETAQGNVELEAKVTPKVREGVVAISNSFGHETAGEANIPQWNPGDPPDQAEAFGLHLVSDPSEGVLAAGPNRQRGAGMYPTCIDPYSRALPPSAPGRGRMPNHAIRRVAGTQQYTGEMAMCPIGASLGWFDSKCRVTKE